MKKHKFVDELPKEEKKILQENWTMEPNIMFKIIRQEGEYELSRSFRALAFSALAAGIFVSFSFFFRSMFHMYMGNSQFEPLVSSLGYTVGFLIVILGRMQLFTENPITTIIPLLSDLSINKFLKVIRLWSIVFLFNIIGTAIVAIFLSSPHVVSPDVANALHEVASYVMRLPALDNIVRGIPAGVIIAVLVWIYPQTKNFRFVTVLFFVYFIALGDFAHVVVGSCEMAYEVIRGNVSFLDYLFRFLIPTGIGNVIGGTGIFTILVFNQVKEELDSDD